MKKICLLPLLLVFACEQPQSDVKEIIEADKAFSALCAEKGMEQAFVTFATDDVIKLQARQPTIIGKTELIESFKRDPESAKLKFSWEPVKADVSGGIGYTFGKCKIVLPPDSTGYSKLIYMNYVTVWKKQKDGSWKYQADAGNVVPPPPEEMK
jgi:ketosteroid isomerase-like protein